MLSFACIARGEQLPEAALLPPCPQDNGLPGHGERSATMLLSPETRRVASPVGKRHRLGIPEQCRTGAILTGLALFIMKI
jgi:hypothetical protein